MANMLTEVYDALREVGASDEKARTAAVALTSAAAEHRPGLDAVRTDLASLRSDLRLIQWQIGALAALVVTVGAPTVWFVFKTAAKLGTLTP